MEAGESAEFAPARETPEQIRARARHLVYERLALTTAVIWTLGTLYLAITIVPYVARPQAYLAMASVIPIIPAALPWLFYRLLVNALVRRWTARSA